MNPIEPLGSHGRGTFADWPLRCCQGLYKTAEPQEANCFPNVPSNNRHNKNELMKVPK